MSADGDVDAVILLLQLLQPDIPAHGDAGMYLNTKRQNGFDLGVQLLTGEAVAGDAVAQHTAQLLPLLVHRDPVTHKGQVVGAAETAGASADDGHLLAGGGSALRLGYHPGVVHGIALQATDIDGIVHHIPAAAGLAGMLADIGAGRGEGIVLADQAHCISAATLPYQRHVAGDIHAGGTQCHTGNGILQARQTAVVLHVLLVVIPEALQPLHHQTGGVTADGTVGGVDDTAGGLFDDGDGLHGSLAVQHLIDQQRQLPQPDPAGDTFAAGLCMAQLQKRQGHIHRTQARRAGGNAPLHIPVKPFHHGLGPAGCLDIQSAQSRTLLSSARRIAPHSPAHMIELC